MTQRADDLTPGERLRLTCELHDLGVAMMRQNLRRRHPGAEDGEIEAMLERWLQTRPGAQHGDVSGPGVRVRRP